MTRFARAKGSKASNEKIPEEATSWLEMKKGILSKSSPPDNPKEPVVRNNENTKSKTATEWASLDHDTVEEYFTLIRKHHQGKNDENSNEAKPSKKKSNKVNANSSNKNSKNIIIQKTKNSHINNEEDCSPVNKNVEYSQPKNSDQIKKNKGKKRKQNGELSEEPLKKKKPVVNNKTETESTIETEKGTKVKKIKNKQKNSNNQVQNHNNTQNQGNSNDAVSNDIKNKKEGMAAKHKKKKLHEINKNNETATRNQKFNGKNKMSNNEKQKGNKQFDKSNNNNHNNNTFKQNKNFSNKKNKYNNDKQSTVEELIVNGEKIQIVKFQGFNVTLEDAERLKKLRNDMFKEGIPRNKLEAAIKLERRRAEKSLSRLKKAVCFHCRGYGHVLSQCPSLTESENTGTGICYKCGSTEHSSAECKVVRGSSFQFAECFICKEQGHIARQCPDNPRGLYPHGGACKECGDVTHLRKDCPKVATKKEEDLITVGVRNDRNLESLEEDRATKKTPQAKTPVRKSVVKF